MAASDVPAPATESVLDEIRDLSRQLSVLITWVSLSRVNPDRFTRNLCTLGHLIRQIGEDVVEHAHSLDRNSPDE